MIAPRNAAAIASLVVLCGSWACTNFYEIPIETPIQPKMDVSSFNRVLVAGFIGGGTEDVDANLETVRLLRSQLRTKSNLRVIEAEVLPLVEMARDQSKPAASDDAAGASAAPASRSSIAPPRPQPSNNAAAQDNEPRIRGEKDLERYNGIFADVAFWKKIGEEYQNPLIVTGHRSLHALSVQRLRDAKRRELRLAGTAHRHPGPHLHGAPRVHPFAKFHLHRRTDGRAASLGEDAGRDPAIRPSRTSRRCRPISS